MNTRFIGLTGGIGSGKSTVLEIFRSMGVPTLDLDQVGKTLLNDPEIIQSLCNVFGQAILLPDQTINRKKLASIAFSSDSDTKTLNAIMHPAIKDYERQWRNQQTAPYCIIEASVLIESKAYQRMDAVIVVSAELSIRKKRVLERGTHNEQAFDLIVNRQCSDEERIAVADYIIENNSSVSELKISTLSLTTQL